jgi:hypothetical protein
VLLCSSSLIEAFADRSRLRKKEVTMICTLVALSPAIGALLGFVYGPSINLALAHLGTKNDAALVAA